MYDAGLSHARPLGHTGWSLWRWVLLRSAGFSARRVLALGSDELATHFELENAASTRLREARSAVLDLCEQLRKTEPENPVVKKASRRVEKHKDVDDTGVPDVDAALAVYRARRQELARLQEQASAVIERARDRAAAATEQIARDPQFREALTWQNRTALHQAVDGLLEGSQDNSKARQRQRLIAKYWQRYTVKNDSIGFFGPIAWGEIDPSISDVEVQHGESLIKDRVHRFEDWVIEALASHLSTKAELQPLFVPRRKAFSWLEGDQLLFGSSMPPRALSNSEAFLLAAADGTRTAQEIAKAAIAEPEASGLTTLDEAYAALAQLGTFNFISWTLDVPSHLDDSAAWLRRELEKLEDPDVRARSLAPLERLERALEDVKAAAGDADKLDRALEKLEQEFVEITGLSAKRGHGQAYASRLLMYEDCSRNLSLKVGRRVVDELAAALSLLLLSARWYTFDVARGFRDEVQRLFRGMCETSGQSRLPLGTFLHGIRGLFPSDDSIPPFVAASKRALHAGWQELLGAERLEHGKLLQVTSDELHARAREIFSAPCPGWPWARYASPDIMLAARDAAAIANGDYIAVLGELHSGANTHLARFASRLHPELEAIKAAWDADMVKPSVSPVMPNTHRASHQSISDTDHHMELAWVRSWRRRENVHLGGDLFVEADGNRLVVRSRRGNVEYDIVEVMQQHLGGHSLGHFTLVGHRSHTPRIMIDKLVVSREQWSLDRSDFEGLVGHSTDAIAKVMRWSRSLGLPRFVFGKVPHEPKPFFIDFGSAVLVEIFIRYLEEAQSLTVSELLPDLDQLWLQDAAGEHYASELRFVAVDPVPWSPTVER